MSNELNEGIKQALKTLLEEFHEAEKMERIVESTKIPSKVELRKLQYLFRYVANADAEVVDEEDKILNTLNDVREKFPNLDSFKASEYSKQLTVAEAHLKELGSFRESSLAKAIAACQSEKKTHVDVKEEHSEAWKELHVTLKKLVDWIKTNAALLTQMETWSE